MSQSQDVRGVNCAGESQKQVGDVANNFSTQSHCDLCEFVHNDHTEARPCARTETATFRVQGLWFLSFFHVFIILIAFLILFHVFIFLFVFQLFLPKNCIFMFF